jgi:hypothetical protein
MDHKSSWVRIGPHWLERLGYTIEIRDANPTRTGQARRVLAVTAALSLAAVMSAITHTLLIAATAAAVVALVALLAFAARRWVLPRWRPLLPAPDPQLTRRTRTTVTSVTVNRIGQPAAPVSFPGTPGNKTIPRR